MLHNEKPAWVWSKHLNTITKPHYLEALFKAQPVIGRNRLFARQSDFWLLAKLNLIYLSYIGLGRRYQTLRDTFTVSPNLIPEPLLKKEVVNIHDLKKKQEDQWAKGGCTLTYDG